MRIGFRRDGTTFFFLAFMLAREEEISSSKFVDCFFAMPQDISLCQERVELTCLAFVVLRTARR